MLGKISHVRIVILLTLRNKTIPYYSLKNSTKWILGSNFLCKLVIVQYLKFWYCSYIFAMGRITHDRIPSDLQSTKMKYYNLSTYM